MHHRVRRQTAIGKLSQLLLGNRQLLIFFVGQKARHVCVEKPRIFALSEQLRRGQTRLLAAGSVTFFIGLCPTEDLSELHWAEYRFSALAMLRSVTLGLVPPQTSHVTWALRRRLRVTIFSP